MDRDAPAAINLADPVKLAEVVPPIEWPLVFRVGAAGVGLIATAAVLGLAASAISEPPSAINTARLLLVLVGSLATGAAVSMRSDLWQTWAIGGVGALLGIVAIPAHWDSFRLLFGALAAVAIGWAVVRALPARYRLPVLSALVMFHFTGIFLATTTPPSTPWVTEQAFIRIFNPYLQFIYQRNAYHFYSPEPGPASVLVFLLKTETGVDPDTGKKLYTTKWVVLPKRPAHVKDPLGLTYYRYLAVTEQVARGIPSLQAQTFEGQEMRNRRELLAAIIPPHPFDNINVQYQLPHSEVARYIIPSYASHVILENTRDAEEASRTTVKMYRMQHNTMGVEEFVNPRKRETANTSPYHPTTYRPYFLGEFDAHGNLLNPQEPMLYWLVPISPRPGGTSSDPTKRNFLDYMSFHALGPEMLGPNTSVDELGDPRFKDRVFDWNQLR